MQTLEKPAKSVNATVPNATGQRRSVIVGIGAIAVIGLIGYGFTQAKTPEPVPVSKPIVAKSVSALGRLEPQGEVIKLAASTSGSRVAQ
ncbi:MAG: hypothetical protein ACKO2V_17435, partial [Snowella sp.]